MTIFGCGRGGITRVKTAGGGGGPTTPSIIGSPVFNANSTETHNTGTVAITPTADTELVLVAVLMTGLSGQDNHLDSVVSDQDGALLVSLDGPASPFTSNTRPGWSFAWIKPTTKEVEHTLTYTVLNSSEAAASMSYSGALAFNIKDIDDADPIGAVRSMTDGTAALSGTDSITLETADCRLLTFGSAQGADTDPFTADLGASLIATGETGTSNSVDGGYGTAQEVVSAAGATTYGFSWSSSDGYGLGAIEIRVKPA